jgi:hypothetical protein
MTPRLQVRPKLRDACKALDIPGVTVRLPRNLRPLLRGLQFAPYASHVSLGLETQPDHETVPMGSLARHRCGPVGHRSLLQRDLEIDLPLMARGLGKEHAVKPVGCAGR